MVRQSDLQPRGRRFESWPLRFTYDHGQVVHTRVPLFTKQYKLVPAQWELNRHSMRDTLAPCPWTYSFSWCRAEGYTTETEISAALWGLVARKGL